MDDIKLIKKATRGCKESIEKLIKSRGAKMYKMAFCYVKNEDLALEVVAEATFKIYINIHKVKKLQYFDSWIGRIVINEAINILRKEKRVISIEDYKGEIPSKSNGEIEEKIDLYNALDTLKEEEKEILVMKYFGDLTFIEIGNILGKSENTIKTKHYRALKKVKTILEGE